MAKMLFVEARNGVLVPGDPWSAETIDKMEPGKVWRIDLKTDRKHGTLNHWWAGLAYMVERFEEYAPEIAQKYPSSRKLHEALLIHLGYVEVIHQLRGGVVLRADSIRFEAMDEAEFQRLFEKARVATLEFWDVDPWQEWQDAKQRDGGYVARRNWRPGDTND